MVAELSNHSPSIGKVKVGAAGILRHLRRRVLSVALLSVSIMGTAFAQTPVS